MGVWDSYTERVNVRGENKREAMFRRETRMLENRMRNTLSYFNVKIDGEDREVSIINSDNLNEKMMISKPKEDFICGSLVDWANNKWLIVEKDANNELYTRVKLLQCNHLLRWIDEQHQIHEQWCVIEDGTKYLTGEYEDREFVVTRGDARIAMTIGRNTDTMKFRRDCRFLIDDPESPHKASYLLTKPLKVGKTYGNEGVYCFVLQEVVSTDYDNMELGIADYYKHFPEDVSDKDNNKDDTGIIFKPKDERWF